MTETLTPADTSVSVGARTRALRRTPEQTRQDFTTLLDVLSRPGKIGRLDVPDGVPGTALAACGLLDVEVPTHVLADDQAWVDAVHAATNAPRAEPGSARTVVALRPVTAGEIVELNRGDALDPELGARLFTPVETVAVEAPGAVVLSLTGPGIRDERRLAIRGLPVDVIEALIAANAAFPAGVDTFLVAADGSVAGLPRTTRVRVERAGD